jgi:hypothetical protein
MFDTDKPVRNKSERVFEKLSKPNKNLIKYEVQKIEKELAPCTFTPSLAKKSVKMAMKSFKKQAAKSGLQSRSTMRSQSGSILSNSRIETLHKLE